MPKGWAEIFGDDIGYRVTQARRGAAWLVLLHAALFTLLAACWSRRPWAYLIVMTGVAATVSLWSGLYQTQREVRRKVAVWQVAADEMQGVELPPEGGPY